MAKFKVGDSPTVFNAKINPLPTIISDGDGGYYGRKFLEIISKQLLTLIPSDAGQSTEKTK
jgi:hypothetical protein